MLSQLPLFIILFLSLNVGAFVLPNKGLARFKRQTDIDANHTPNKENSRCNNEALEKLMLESIGDDVKESKLKIMENAEAKLGGTFNVICSVGDFSYITSTRIYCLTGNESVKCYAFLADSSSVNTKV
ncbi:Ground-like domain-containing protein [Aphelenchoides bicaudatus]|nr:Ground-like domain-containing protein [Aphelenchoides bicaudatus]